MATDALLSRDLKSLNEELSAAKSNRPKRTAAAAAVAGSLPPKARQDQAEDQRLHDELGKLAEAIQHFIEESGKDALAHPAANIVGGIVVGLLIGRLLGRPQERPHA